jgi:hypothetical protein
MAAAPRGTCGSAERDRARRATPPRIASVLTVTLHLLPALLLPLGLITLPRAHSTAARAAAIGCIAAGAAWIYEGWQFLSCEDEPQPCGAPDWLDTLSAVVLIAGLLLAIGGGVRLALRRGRRSRPAR